MASKEQAVAARRKQLERVRIPWNKGQLMPLSLLNQQAARDPEAKGPVWVSRASFKAPAEDDLRQALFRSLRELAWTLPLPFDECAAVDVQGEWVAHRPGVSKDAPEPSMTSSETFAQIQQALGPDAATVFYIHGGGHITGSPSGSRLTTGRLAKAAQARVFAPRYRLAPRNNMPAQLLDLAVAYLSLLQPPQEESRSALRAEDIVFAGDSSGAGLALSLLALLLHLKRSGQLDSIVFNGKQLPRDVIPSRLALLSGFPFSACQLPEFFDPGLTSNDVGLGSNPLHHPDRKVEPGLWPALPPREHWLCGKALLNHPLVEPLLVSDTMWQGAPPVWMAMGEERTAPGMRLVTGALRRAGTSVTFLQFEGMCHIWPLILPQTPSAAEAWKLWPLAIQGEALNGDDTLIEEGTLRRMTLKSPDLYQSRESWDRAIRIIRERNDNLPAWEGPDKSASKVSNM